MLFLVHFISQFTLISAPAAVNAVVLTASRLKYEPSMLSNFCSRCPQLFGRLLDLFTNPAPQYRKFNTTMASWSWCTDVPAFPHSVESSRRLLLCLSQVSEKSSHYWINQTPLHLLTFPTFLSEFFCSLTSPSWEPFPNKLYNVLASSSAFFGIQNRTIVLLNFQM